jgi:hypothetical protein
MLIPDKNQLSKIKKYLPSGTVIDAEELVYCTFIATDNLVSRRLSKWGIDELEPLANLLLGLPFTLNHEWGEVEESQGFIFDARIIEEDAPPTDILNAAGNGDNNRQIVKNEGYCYIECDVCFPAYSPIISGIKYGIFKYVSLGGFVYEDHVCPICECSFDDKRCSHYLPGDWTMNTSDRMNTAPYYIRSSVYDLGELSLVLIPNIPGAKVK